MVMTVSFRAFQDLKWRVTVFTAWLEHGPPHSFALPAFFNPQGLLTAILQRHARTHAVPINELSYTFKFPVYTEVSKHDLYNGVHVYCINDFVGGLAALTHMRCSITRAIELRHCCDAPISRAAQKAVVV